MKENTNIVILGIILLIVAGSAAGFFYWQNSSRSETQISGQGGLCSEFLEVEGEITCEEAKNISTEKYPGQVLNIEKTTLLYRVGRNPKAKTEEREVWLVGIKPNDALFLPLIPQNPDDKETKAVETIGVV
ncbi:MAG: hypothetical protein Q8P55_01080, partial [bacterium]|nr:hypothetical protein [bacterium]